jgi:hypothetical protein
MNILIDLDYEKQLVSDTILLKYISKGQSNEGIINLKFSYNSHKETLEFLYVDYSDDEIKSYVEENPSVLSKIYSQRQLQN